MMTNMKKYQDALNELHKEALWYASEMSGVNGSYDELEKATNDKVLLIQELVDKATPMEVRFIEICAFNKRKEYECPKCNVGLNQDVPYEYWYCPECGQRLDWSDT